MRPMCTRATIQNGQCWRNAATTKGRSHIPGCVITARDEFSIRRRGHDQRTWGTAGFKTLVRKGIRWASANSPTSLKVVKGLKPFEYMEAPSPLPNYVVSERWGVQGDPIRTMQKPLTPEESLKHLALFPGFEKSLFANEPDIVKPIWIAWDHRGRLWIAETIDYPNEMQPPGQGRDRLKICEDTN